jgi:hypothetical protein
VSKDFIPSKDEVKRISSTLLSLRYQRDAYWSTFADMVGRALAQLTEDHVLDCTTEGCLVCRQVGQAWIPLSAHMMLHPRGCPCPTCRTVPVPMPRPAAN